MAPSAPIATYRLQLTAAFGFREAAAIAPYLRALGISHVYASPILKARADSTHGYDMVDASAIDPKLGGENGFAELAAALRAAGLGLIADFVPNHMGVLYADNAWWLDVLEWGRASLHARAFDIEWNALPFRRRPGLLLPVLGRPYAEALEGGDIVLRYDAAAGSFSAWYYEHRLPIAPSCYRAILRAVVRRAGRAGDPAGRALLALAAALRHGHPTREEAPAFKAALAATPGAADVIAAGLDAYAGRAPGGIRALHRLLERQYFRLAHWRLAASLINYRRFFDINALAGLRVEDDATFRAVHARIGAMIGAGSLAGLRLDHIDGLSDPADYCRRLHAMIADVRPQAQAPAPAQFHVYVEKILGDGEPMPRFACVDGTTGYEWLNVISRVLLDARGMPALDRGWRDVGGEPRAFAEVLAAAKREVLAKLFASEFSALCRLLARIAAGHARTRDFADARLRAALADYIVAFPVYRTYVTAAGAGEADRAVIARAIAAAQSRAGLVEGPLFDFLRDAVTLDLIAKDRGYSRTRAQRFVRKLQQLTAPVIAKALEDTAFYRFHRLIALNEVGGDPAAHALAIEDFHRRMGERVAACDRGLTATATHDTKRGEDARARILALSEIADDWAAAVAQWRRLNLRHVRKAGERRAPSAAHEYMLYQALLGAWPLGGDIERFQAFARKAAREGKEETSWIDPDAVYEDALAGFIADIFGEEEFVQNFDAFASRAALLGALNSLTQLALKVAMPGVPDFYQGTEFWDLSLVDPDNRRPVDFAARERELQALSACSDLSALVEGWRQGSVKLALTQRLLAWRRAHHELFAQGDYRPLAVAGAHRDHVIAFARTRGEAAAVLVVGRHFAALTDGGRHWPRAEAWQGHVDLAGISLSDREPASRAAQDRPVPLAALFDPLPVAMLSGRTQNPRVSREGSGRPGYR